MDTTGNGTETRKRNEAYEGVKTEDDCGDAKRTGPGMGTPEGRETEHGAGDSGAAADFRGK